MCSIKAQAAKANIDYSDKYDLLVNPKEIELVKHINEFRNVIIDSAIKMCIRDRRKTDESSGISIRTDEINR